MGGPLSAGALGVWFCDVQGSQSRGFKDSGLHCLAPSMPQWRGDYFFLLHQLMGFYY